MAWTCVFSWAGLQAHPRRQAGAASMLGGWVGEQEGEGGLSAPTCFEEPCALLGAPPLRVYSRGLHFPPLAPLPQIPLIQDPER